LLYCWKLLENKQGRLYKKKIGVLWVIWNLVGNINSKYDFAKSFEEFKIMNEGGKTFLERTKIKELMEDKVECKDGITPFGSLI